LKTKEIVEETGIDRETLRFYETRELLPEIKRTTSGYRIFPANTVARIRFIQMAKQAGFTLTEIKELIDLQQKRGPCRLSRDMAKEKKKELTKKIKLLREMDRILSRFISECEKNGEDGLRKACHFSFDSCC